ncbi:hypothetical protein NDU88_006375 [Pleurodeles waltl]|uniref:Uncharacterized protein n=1 Tax=Pleurodeles waltl TaxID=8319 RepID=A0AAV7VLS0_PLEWA|nr:hypothetical protein NDU88_006375 [Pleurodeles waltl]
MYSVGVLGAYPFTRDGHRASQPPPGARPESRSRPRLDSRATFSPDRGDPASRGPGYPSLLPGPAQMHRGSRPPEASFLTAVTFRLPSAHKGPGLRIAGPATPASSTERPPQ